MSQTVSHRYQFGEFTVDVDQKVLLRNGAPLPLAPKVFETLMILVENGGRIVEKEALMNRVWPDVFVEEANLTFNIQQLRKVLGDSARKPLFIETVSRRGYRFIAHAELVNDTSLSADQISIPIEAQHSQATGTGDVPGNDLETIENRRIAVRGGGKVERGSSERIGGASAHLRPRQILVTITVVAVVITSGWLLWRRFTNRPQLLHERPMLAVLPFRNLTGDESQDYFSDGLTEEMITQVGNLDPQHLGVIARTSVMHYKNTEKPLDQIGRELGVQYVLEGSVRRESDIVRITAQLIQTKDQTHLWSQEYDRDLSHVLLLQGEIAVAVAAEIRLTLSDSQKRPDTARQASLSPQGYEAYDLYLKGQYFFNKRTGQGFEQAIDYYQQATIKDPGYARAYAGLADCYALIGGYSGRPQTEFMPKARAAALRAVAIDESLAEAHTALALVVQNYDWDWKTAEKEFRRAIELNPNYATAHHWYAEHLTWLGRFDEALVESERARQLDPLSLIIAADKGAILYYSRQYERSIAQFLAVKEMDPNFPRSYMIDAAYEQKGLFGDALTNIEKLQQYGDSPWTLSELAYVQGRTGQQAQAKRTLEKLLDLNRRQPVDPATLLEAYIGVDDKEQAFVYLEKAYAQHSNALTTLKVEPRFDPLRSDARFQEMERRVGLRQ